ncbi:nicotinamide-nucleotide adenylyltransferase [Candidatus Woesearchaeota archaeon]|nr:nicotinamide-nucleotide adenylyltransferase [Candidatus Woesearchaeota archaeon]
MHRALFIGRFQPFHNAHLIDVQKVLKEVDEVIIAIGSSREKDTLENPFSYNERKKMIEAALKKAKIKKYEIYPVPDLYNDRKWVEYIKKNLPRYEFVYSGNLWTLKCFKKYDSKVRKIRLIKGINSTKIRDMMIKGKEWQKLVPKEIVDYIRKTKGVERVKSIHKPIFS